MRVPQQRAARERRLRSHVPALAAVVASFVGVVNLVSALTPNFASRTHTLRVVEPVDAVPFLHAIAVPLSVLLVVVGLHLGRRRRRAWQVALVLLVALVPIDLLKGLDVEEAAITAVGVLVLAWGRDAFTVEHAPIRAGRAALTAAATVAFAFLVAVLLVWLGGAGHPTGRVAARAAIDAALWRGGDVVFGDEARWVPDAIGVLGMLVVAVAGWRLFRPLAAPRSLPDAAARREAAGIVRAHGADTLAFFKLRHDKHYLFAADGSGFVGYRVESGVMLVSGDPVCPPGSLRTLVRETCGFAARRGLRVAALGASREAAVLWREAGLHALYLGDEAIVETASFSTEGRSIRKVRQSVHRLEKAGYTTTLCAVAELRPETVAEVEAVSERWRAGADERGFAMAMDALRSQGAHADELVLLARDGAGAIRGFLHFVPAYGRPALSLSLMRRDEGTPNGLTEFMVVRAIEAVRERGVEELSLNFAAFARWLHAPRGRLERLLGSVAIRFDRYFQIESLYRFNAKFAPRWEPRYLVYSGVLGLPRAGLAAAWVEGQIRKPRLPRALDRAA